MIQTFAQEISIAVTGYGGYVFKYEGDAVFVLFPAEYDQPKACKNALNCTTSIPSLGILIVYEKLAVRYS